MKKNIVNLLITLVFGGIIYYFMLPPINLSSPLFWFFVVILFVIYIMCSLVNSGVNIVSRNGRFDFSGDFASVKSAKYAFFALLVIFAGIIVVNLICSPIFNATAYGSRIEVLDDTEFNEDVAEVDFSKVPLLDKASSRKLGDRKMGQMADLVSQYVVSDLYTQINYNDEIVRVTPLEYADVIKYFTNKKTGVPGYILVDSVSGESNLIRLDKGMKYMPSAMFGEDLARKLRFEYPTAIFGDPNFEIDNEGNPYWIVPTIKYVGVGLRTEISSIVVLDAISGKSEKYELNSVPEWIDHVYEADLIIEQVDNWGEYNSGFFNSLFGQKNVVNTTDGYNYLALNGDIYVYTGITSVSTDESNIGFILSNMRTKETHFYAVPGAEEYSAMASAEGLVQEKQYVASFPLLINLNNRATYFLSLKDAAGLVKMYAFVDVEDYQKVTTSDSSLGIDAAANKYLSDYSFDKTVVKTLEKKIKIKTIENVVIDGNTYYYISDNDNLKYVVSIKTNRLLLPFIGVGASVEITYSENEVNEIIALRMAE